MAEEAEDIVIIAEDDAAKEDTENELNADNNDENDDDSQKLKILLVITIAVAILVIITITTIVLLKSKKEHKNFSMQPIEEKLKENKQKPIEPSKLENMIAKANYLYTNGSKEKALSLYEQIAIYSEAISKYNLGVAQLKNEQYELALQTFQQAIQNDEKRCVSAINAAVCSLHLKKQNSFKYYINLAYAYLPNEINSPLYSYYYTLINYYSQNYLEALVSLKHSTSTEYPEVQKHLTTKINALFGNDYDAIEAMEKNLDSQDYFNIALLYTRVGDLTLAQNYFEESILRGIKPLQSKLALAFVDIKAGKVTSASDLIEGATKKYPEDVYKYYPIKVKLKDSLFNAEKAQLNYRNNILKSKLTKYQKIFYFSPYKVFNANNTISYIRKGNANIYIDNINSAKTYLKKGLFSSSVNAGIAKAIKKALSFKIREANEELVKLLKIQPKHSILHYNIALTYAQMGNMKLAYKHFIRSYHLDAKNYLSGVYAVLTAQLLNKDILKLKSIIKDMLEEEIESEEKNLYKTLLYISDNNILASYDWLNYNYKQRPLYLALKEIIALDLNKLEIAKKSAKKLTILLPNDILPHLMYIDAAFNSLEPKKYASKVLNYLKVQKFHFNDLYYGPAITRELYIQQKLITGKLYFLDKQLKTKLETTKHKKIDIIKTLALVSLYDKKFEKSYTLYNQLIDEFKERDAHTLFLGAVASTAASHHENAIALLELSKMKDKSYVESRYALGLLYLQVKNNGGAVIQLSKVGDDNFNSNFFDFEIDTDKLLFEKEHN